MQSRDRRRKSIKAAVFSGITVGWQRWVQLPSATPAVLHVEGSGGVSLAPSPYAVHKNAHTVHV